MRLIDADALEKILTEKGDDYKVSMFATADDCNIARSVAFECAEEVKNAPTIEAEPVRHGKWVRNDLGETYCSECHSRIPYVRCYDLYPDCCMDDEDMQWDEEIERTSFCPHCGAKMRGEKDE